MGTPRLVNGLTTAESATRLGVNQSRVRQLLAKGLLKGERLASGDWVVDPASIATRLQQRPTAGRTWKSRTAWTALLVLAGGKDHVAVKKRSGSGSQTDRVTRDLAHNIKKYDASTLATKLTSAIQFYWFDAEDPQSIRGELDLTGRSCASLVNQGLRDRTDVVEGYATADRFRDMVKRHALVESSEGNVGIGVIPDDMDHLWTSMRTCVIAVDLTRSTSVRERTAGVRALTKERQRWLRTWV